MLNQAAFSLPAASEETTDGTLFSLRHRLRLRDNLGFFLRMLREMVVFVGLARGPWAVFGAIAAYWQCNEEAWPNQETIAAYTGYSSRAVRRYVAVLERNGIVRLRYERRPNGWSRIYYAPGLVTLSGLSAIAERYPSERLDIELARAVQRAAANASPTLTPPPDTMSATPPDTMSAEPGAPVRSEKDVSTFDWRPCDFQRIVKSTPGLAEVFYLPPVKRGGKMLVGPHSSAN